MGGPDLSLAEMLWAQADVTPGAIAVAERDRSTSYADLRERSATVAGGLTDIGIRPGDRVAILLERGAEAAAAFLGALAAGAVAININETLRPRQIEHILGHSGASALITTALLLNRLPRPLETPARILEASTLAGNPISTPFGRDPDDAAQISYTSGSTGNPKGVVVSHGNLSSVTRTVVDYLGLSASDRIASLLPFSFVYGMNQLLCTIGCGGTLVVERATLPQQMVSALAAQRVTVLAAVPSLWAQLLTIRGFASESLPSLRVVTNAGGGIAPELVRRIRQAQPHARLFLMYGLTEALRSTYLPAEEVDAHPDAIGRPIPGTEIRVLREDGTQCEPGEVGELVQTGPTVALGYWNDPAATAVAFRDPEAAPGDARGRGRSVHSGDLVRRDADGILYFVGRRDYMIKTLGYRVAPDEICNVLYASGLVSEAVVTSEPCPQRGERIVACVVLAPGATVDGLDRYCKVELPRYMQPARMDVRDALPRLPNGKFDVRAIRDAVRSAAAVAAENPAR